MEEIMEKQLEQLGYFIERLTDEVRVNVFANIAKGYCKDCGSYCTNDE